MSRRLIKATARAPGRPPSARGANRAALRRIVHTAAGRGFLCLRKENGPRRGRLLISAHLQNCFNWGISRRHLTESQRSMVAAKIAKLPRGGDRRSDQAENLPLGPSQTQAAEMLNVSDRSIRTAKRVQERGAPELVSAVESGAVSVSAARLIAASGTPSSSRVAKPPPFGGFPWPAICPSAARSAILSLCALYALQASYLPQDFEFIGAIADMELCAPLADAWSTASVRMRLSTVLPSSVLRMALHLCNKGTG